MTNELTTGTKANPIAQHSSVDQRAVTLTEEQMLDTIQNILYPGSKRESALMVLNYCKAAKIDPMAKAIHIVPMSVKNKDGKYEYRDTIMPGIGYYRLKAIETGQWGGMDEPEFGPTVTKTLGGMSVTYPEWCSITVHRIIGDAKVSATKREYWLENYAAQGRDSLAPNTMWAKRPYAQLEKCCESQALRRAFPDIASIPTAEEMEDKDIFEDVTPSRTTNPVKAQTIDNADISPSEPIQGKFRLDNENMSSELVFTTVLEKILSVMTLEHIDQYEAWKRENSDEMRRYALAYPADAKELANKYNMQKEIIMGELA